MKTKFLALLISSSVIMTLSACGSSGGGGSDVVAPGTVETLGITNCAICHSAATVATFEWLSSRHAAGTFGGTNPVCLVCHDNLGDGQLMQQAFIDEPNRNVVGCESCHGGGSAHFGIGPLPFPLPGPAQCGRCHGIEAALTGRHANNPDEMIHDTHFDNPATAFLDGTTNVAIEGYVVKTAEQDGCQACHYNAHTLDLEINREWARSAHGGFILDIKDAAFAISTAAGLAAAVTDDAAPGWTHYNWDQSIGAGNRADCQRCHTATGAMNFMNDSINYSPADNDFSYLADWTAATGSPQNEMLYCWGCHRDNSANLRASGNLTLDFVFIEDPGDGPVGEPEFVVLPDKGNSNVCAACHSGRGNNTSIRSGNRSNRFAGHHAPTAGSLYAEFVHTGFEFTGQNYTPGPDFEHDDILLNGTSPETGAGPCVGCHMAGTANHRFEAVTEDDLGFIVAINSQALCNSCHGIDGLPPVDPAFLNQRRLDFADARQILLDLVSNTVPNYLNANLTLRSDPNAVPPRPIGFDNAPLEAYGAFQNSLYMTEEPCIYVHNDQYGRRLIFDSIDWLEDGELNGAILIDTVTYPNAANWLGDGTIRP